MLLTCYPRRGGRGADPLRRALGTRNPGRTAARRLASPWCSGGGRRRRRGRLRALPARGPRAPSGVGCTSTARRVLHKLVPRASSELLTSLSLSRPFPPPAPTAQCRGLMSDDCGRTSALAAGRARKGAREEGLVSEEGSVPELQGFAVGEVVLRGRLVSRAPSEVRLAPLGAGREMEWTALLVRADGRVARPGVLEDRSGAALEGA